MPQKLLGLDIGSFSIKAALFETTFKHFQLTDLYESPPLQMEDVDPEDRSVIIKEALLRLIEDNTISSSTVVTALSGVAVSTRVLTLPLPERQIEKVLPFELESHLPFDLDEIIVDHHTISTSKVQTVCLAAAVKKVVIAEHLAALKSANLDAAFVGLDSLALLNLTQLPLKDEFGTYAVVDIGHQKTSVCIVSNQEVKFVRTLFSGGRMITDAISKALDLTREQAQEVKHSHGILELESRLLKSKDLRRLSTAIRQVIDPLLREIIQTFQAYRAQYSQVSTDPKSVEKVYLCGGSSLLRNLPEYVQSLTNVPSSLLNIFPENHEAAERLGRRQAVMAQAVALGLRVAARGANASKIAMINFRKSGFAFARDFSGLKDKAVFFGRWAAVLFFIALLHLGFRYQNLARQRAELDRKILRIYSDIIPNDPNKPKNASLALKNLEVRIQKYQEQQEILTAGLNELTALGILRDISARIPQDVPLDTQELSIDRNKINLRANTDSIPSVDKIIAALKENPKYQRIEKGDIRESPDGKRAFNITILVGEETEKKPAQRKQG